MLDRTSLTSERNRALPALTKSTVPSSPLLFTIDKSKEQAIHIKNRSHCRCANTGITARVRVINGFGCSQRWAFRPWAYRRPIGLLVLLSAVSTLCPLATLFPACAAIGHATTAAIIRTDFRRMNDAPDVSASVCWFKQIGKLEPWALGRHPPEFLNPIAALRFRTLFGPKRKPNSARPGRPRPRR